MLGEGRVDRSLQIPFRVLLHISPHLGLVKRGKGGIDGGENVLRKREKRGGGEQEEEEEGEKRLQVQGQEGSFFSRKIAAERPQEKWMEKIFL